MGLKNIEEKNSEKNKIKNDLNNIKLKGIFERYRLNLIKKSIEDELSIDLKDKLIEGAEIWKKPEPEKNYIIIGNTHGNASISFVLKTERKNSYGIQWQAGSVKIFIQFENLKNIEIETDLKKKRRSTKIISEEYNNP